MKVDWELFKSQKEILVKLTENPKMTPIEIDALDGIINFMDAYQDLEMVLEDDEDIRD
jgi:cell fate (sporulation/competence/biofilm development) regulator YlbF (YheA/YmcA/DUF963 family)